MPGTNAELDFPQGVWADGSGNVLIADSSNSRIRELSPNGWITTVAGNGYAGYSGDTYQATYASLQYPRAVCGDGNGGFFIADTVNNRVRHVSSGGIISTYAGTGATGFGGDHGQANAAIVSEPQGLCLDSAGDLYIADGSNRVRKVDAGGTITTVAGNGSATYAGDHGAATSASLNFPTGLSLDGNGNLFIADTFNFRVRKVDTTGTITTVAGNGTFGYLGDNGPATSAELEAPSSSLWGISSDAAGNLYISDSYNNRIRRVDGNGIIVTVVGTGASGFSGDGGPGLAAKVASPAGIFADGLGHLYIADAFNERVRVVTCLQALVTPSASPTGTATGSPTATASGTPTASPTASPVYSATASPTISATFTISPTFSPSPVCGLIHTLAGVGTPGYSGDGGAATGAMLNWPQGIAYDGNGNLYVADTYNNRIRRVDTFGNITTVAGSGSPTFGGDGGPALSAGLGDPTGISVDPNGNVYVADTSNNRIRRIDRYGNITTVAGTSSYGSSSTTATSQYLNGPSGVCADSLGNIFVLDHGAYLIRKVDSAGNITTVAGTGTPGNSGDGGPATLANLAPSAIALDGHGNLYFADSMDYCIREVNSAGDITTVAGTGAVGYSGEGGQARSAHLAAPASLAFDGYGNLFFVDGSTHVRKISITGIITTVAGNGSSSASGDGGPALSAGLDDWGGLGFDPSGNLIVGDSYNNRIRSVGCP